MCLVATIAITSAQTVPNNEIWFTTHYGNVPIFFENNNLSSLIEYRDDIVVIKFDDSIDINYIISNAFKDCISLTSITIGNGVTEIGDYAFKGCSSLTSTIIPSGVTEIGDGAFQGCSSLTSITIPDSVTSIGGIAFQGCSSLTSITIPDSVTSIGGIAFSGCHNLRNITIPSSVTYIGDSAFAGCYGELIVNCNIPNGEVRGYYNAAKFYFPFKDSRFSNVIVGEGVTKIGSYAFRGCQYLKSITIPDSVTEIGYNAFGGCKSLESITIPNSTTKIEDELFWGCIELSSVTIPDSVTEIGNYAFKGCDDIESITIPDSVTKIGSYVFEDCSWLRKMTIGKGVTEIADDAFKGCDTRTVDVTVSNKYCYDYFYGKYWGVKVILNSEYISQDGRCLIVDGELAVCQLSGLLKYDIPKEVTKIGQKSFKGCSSITSITIPDSVTSIGDSAFEGCSSLTSLTIPSSVTSIGSSAFKGCSGLTNITIPESVTNIEGNAFEGCSMLKSIKVGNVLCYDILAQSGLSISAFTGSNASADGRCLINNGKLERFIATGLTSYDFPESVKEISAKAMNKCKKLKSATVTNTACYVCVKDGIANVRFGGSNASSDGRCLIIDGKLITLIGNELTEYTIPQDVTNMNNSVFTNCDGLTSITIPSGVTTIGDQQFSSCNALARLTCLATTPPAISNLSITETTMIYVPKNAIKEYKKDLNWTKYKKQIKPID